jgi:hypothetical protein
LIDLLKAYDSVDRRLLFRLMKRRCKTPAEIALVELIMKLHENSTIEIGSSSLNAEMGLPKGSVLSLVLFNVYLEDALNSSSILHSMRKRGDLLAFADDMLGLSPAESPQS